MENCGQGTESLIAVESDFNNSSSDTTPTEDQYFLLHFIMGAYFAPDLKDEPRKSIFQRCAEGLPPYTADQLAGSHIKTVELERIYYYILRKADRSVIVKLPWLHQFLHGKLPTPVDNPGAAYLQFDALFPPRLHPHSRFKDQYNVIENIAFIKDPEINYIKPGDIEKFKRLTRLEHLHLDEKSARMYTLVLGEALYNVVIQVESNAVDHPQNAHVAQPNSGARIAQPDTGACIGQPDSGALYGGGVQDCNLSCNGARPFRSLPHNSTPLRCRPTTSSPTNNSSMDEFEQGMLFLSARPSKEEWCNIIAANKSGFALTGSAATGQIGPVLGLVDIGESDDSYLFRVSLPGVKRDEKDFSCEVENEGKVLIRGVTTTGEKTVHKYSQVFEMQSQNLCPSGPFSISFKLPGPVDPRQFSGNFGTDGILEGIVMKAGRSQKAVT